MTFVQLDQLAFDQDRALSAAHGTLLVQDVKAVRDDRRRGAGCCVDVREPLILSGDGSGGGLEEDDYTTACALPLLWRPGRLDVSELTLEVWGANPSAALAVQLAVKAVPLGVFLSDGPGDEPSDWTTLAASTTDRVELTCSLAGLRWREGDLLVVLLAVRSQVGEVQVLYDVKASVDTTGILLAYTGDGNRLIVDPAALWGGADAQADTREPFRLLFGSANTSGLFDPAAFEAGGPWGITGQEFGATPTLHALAQRGDDIYAYPYVTAEIGTPSLTSAMARQAMGSLELLGLHLRDSDAGAFELSTTATGIGVPASGLVVGAVVQELEDQFTLTDGPVALGVDQSSFTDSILGGAASRAFADNAIGAAGGWSTLQTWAVGGPRSSFTPTGGSATLRNTYILDALVAWVDANNGADPAEALLGFRAVIADSGGDIEGDEVITRATALHFATTGHRDALASSASRLWAHLFGWNLGGGGYAYRGRHSLRDQLPWGLMQRPTTLLRVRVEVSDGGAGSSSTTVPQLLRLEARFAPQARYPAGSSIAGHDAVHVLAALVDWPISNNPSDLG